MKKLAIIGAGDLGRQLCHLAVTDKQYIVVGFYDDFVLNGQCISGYSVLGPISKIKFDFNKKYFDCLILAIGYNDLNSRAEIFEAFNKYIPFGVIIHSQSHVDPTAKIGQGTIIYPGCIIDQHVIIESNVLLHVGCNIAHDTIIRRHTYVSPSVSLAGFVEIGERCNIGINTTIIDHITLTNCVRTGGGTVVINNIDQPGLYVGNPARFIR